MPLTANDLGAINAGISALPLLIDLIRSIHGVSQPTDPPLTDSQVLAILMKLGADSIAKDDAWRAAHPNA